MCCDGLCGTSKNNCVFMHISIIICTVNIDISSIINIHMEIDIDMNIICALSSVTNRDSQII